MRRLIIIFSSLLLICCNNESSEKNKPLKKSMKPITKDLIGRQYSMQDQQYLQFPYERSYTNNGSLFVTTYQTFNPRSGNPIHKITVQHDTLTKVINVNVKAIFGGALAPDDINYSLTVSDEFRNFKPWGREGFYRKAFGTAIPFETLIQFATEDFSFLNLLEIQSEENHGERYWYILDKPISTIE